MITRYMTSAALGLAMASALLFLMHTLIDTGNAAFSPKNGTVVERWIHQPIKEEPPMVAERFDRIDTPRQPPTNSLPESNYTIDGTGGVPFLPSIPIKPGPLDSLLTRGDSPLVSIVRVQPVYPPRATTLGLEGFVTVGYDVSPAGSVMNVVVLNSSHPIFEKAAMDAAYRFRFKPRVVDGLPTGTTGMRNRFRFEMEP